MTKTDERITTTPPPSRRGIAWAVGAFVAVLALGGVVFAVSRGSGTDDGGVTAPTASPATTTTTTPATTEAAATTTDTAAPLPTGADDVALFQEAVSAWYANDVDRISELLVVPYESWDEDEGGERTIDDVADRMAYDAAIDSRLQGLTCSAPATSGDAFACRFGLRNALTDALGWPADGQPISEITVRVDGGRVVEYKFDEHGLLTNSVGMYLALTDQLAGYEQCYESLVPECADIQLQHLNEWAAWNQTATNEDLANAYLNAFFSGDCETLWAITGPDNWSGAGFERTESGTCPPEVEYESAMEGTLELSACESDGGFGDNYSCDGSYSNILSRTIGAEPASVPVSVTFWRWFDLGVWESAALESAHPQDKQLLRTFKNWAREAGLGETFDEACGAGLQHKTPACATFLIDNLDAWAAWYPANS